MVKEVNDTEVYKKFITEDGKFFIRLKEFTLQKFEDQLCKPRYKNDIEKKLGRIQNFLLSRLKQTDREVRFGFHDYETAFEEMKTYLFKGYL